MLIKTDHGVEWMSLHAHCLHKLPLSRFGPCLLNIDVANSDWQIGEPLTTTGGFMRIFEYQQITDTPSRVHANRSWRSLTSTINNVSCVCVFRCSYLWLFSFVLPPCPTQSLEANYPVQVTDPQGKSRCPFPRGPDSKSKCHFNEQVGCLTAEGFALKLQCRQCPWARTLFVTSHCSLMTWTT